MLDKLNSLINIRSYLSLQLNNYSIPKEKNYYITKKINEIDNLLLDICIDLNFSEQLAEETKVKQNAVRKPKPDSK